jgi:hypothetical protein
LLRLLGTLCQARLPSASLSDFQAGRSACSSGLFRLMQAQSTGVNAPQDRQLQGAFGMSLRQGRRAGRAFERLQYRAGAQTPKNLSASPHAACAAK